MSRLDQKHQSSIGTTRRSSLAALLFGCVAIALSSTASLPAKAADKVLRVGIMSGEEEDVWRVVTAQAAKRGLTIQTVVFNDYTQPNEALENGEIEANAFQHQPYLDNQIKQRGYHIVGVGYTGVWPIGLYSLKYDAVGKLPEGATIGVPNDPSNEGRALKLLADQGLISLSATNGIVVTIADIVANPKNIQIKELDAGMVGRAAQDLDAAVVNTDWALKSGLSAKERIAQEPVEGNPYRNFIAVRTADRDQPWVKTLVESYQNAEVRAVFEQVYKGTGLVAYSH